MKDLQTAPSPRELERLLQGLEDGVIGTDDLESLESWLERDPQVRKAYCEHMLFAAALHSEAVDRQWLAEEGAYSEKAKTPARQFGAAVLAAAAVLALVAVVLSLFAVKPPPPAAIRSSEGASWAFDAGGLDEERDFLPDSRLVVERGTVRVDFSSGTEVHLAAPATLIVRDRMDVELESGSAWFTIAKGDEGFSVVTKTLRAVDLGTEFGIETSRSGAEVHVAKGRVRVESLLPRQAVHELGAGKAIRSDTFGYLEKTDYGSEKFPKSLAISPRMIHWSFDGDDPLAGRTNHGSSARISVHSLNGKSVETSFGKGPKGMALDLGGQGIFAASDYVCPLGSTPRTVAFWFRKKDGLPLDGRGHGWRNPPIVSWGDDRIAAGKWHVGTTNDGTHLAANWGGSWNVSHMPKGTRLFNAEWHHLASVFTGEELADGSPDIIHYLDGERMETSAVVAKSPVRTRPYPEKWRQLAIGYFDFEEHAPGTLPMQIDELVIADFAFSPEMILKLAGGGEPDFGNQSR